MVQDPYGVLADSRINDNIDFSDIKTKEDYKKKVKEYLNNTPDQWGNYRGKNVLLNGDYPLDEMYENSKAKDKIEQNRIKIDDEEKKALRRAQRFHAHRPARSRKADERTTAKMTRRASKSFVRRWAHRHGRGLDVRGVDTKTRFKVAETNRITRLDMRLKNTKVTLSSAGIKQYRYPAGSKDNSGKSMGGKFRSNPYKRSNR
jgi:hypothetical protein